jgi:hypothetical protein
MCFLINLSYSSKCKLKPIKPKILDEYAKSKKHMQIIKLNLLSNWKHQWLYNILDTYLTLISGGT